MFKHVSLFLFFLLIPFQSLYAADTGAAKNEDIKRLMEITGSAGVAKQFASMTSQQMAMILKKVRPEIPDRAIEIMNTEIIALFTERVAAPGGLLDQMVSLYDKYFTHQEIKELLAFYDTPIGRKTIAILPQITAESMALGQQWGESLGSEIRTRVFNALEKEGLMPEGM